ncbi:MAG: hypothetical protein M3Y17_00005 [Actinomycetota bacterium]|nr:hypothetical protein [Actinomycetota bacterium]
MEFNAAARERACRSPLIHLQFYFELPFDVGIEVGAFNRIQLSHPCLEDWADFDLQAYLGMPPLPEPCVRPCVVLRFRRVSRPNDSPFANVRRAYGAELGSAIPAEADFNSFETSVSVVKAEVIATGPSGDFDEQWLRGQLRIVLVKLNEILIALGAAADDHHISPVTESDLPPIILGWQQDLRDLDTPSRKPRLVPLLLHEGQPRRVVDHDSTVINHALAIAGRGGHGPFFPTMEMLFAARRSLESGRLAAAVLDSGTAVELLVSNVVRGVGMSQSWDPQRLENVLSEATGFRNRFVAHFARALGVTVDASASGDDPVSTWLRIAYPLRNKVVHAGHRPLIEEAANAIVLAFSLMDFVAECVERDPNLGTTFPDIDEMLPGPGVDERSLAHGPPSERRLAQESFDAGLHAVAEHDEATAVQAFEQSYNHGSPKAAFNIGIIKWRGGDADGAITWLRRASEEGHDGASAYLGVLLLGRGDDVGAEELLRRGSESTHQRGRPVAMFFLATILADRGELREAADVYREAAVVADFALGAEAAFRRGSLLQELGDPTAIDAYTLGVDLGSGRAAVALAAHHGVSGATNKALELLHQALDLAAEGEAGSIPIGHHIAVQLDPDRHSVERRAAQSLVMTGGSMDEQGRGQDARKVYDQLVEKFADATDLGLREAAARALVSKSASLGREGDHSGAVAVCDELIALFGDATAPEIQVQVANGLINKAYGLHRLGSPNEVRGHL